MDPATVTVSVSLIIAAGVGLTAARHIKVHTHPMINFQLVSLGFGIPAFFLTFILICVLRAIIHGTK